MKNFITHGNKLEFEATVAIASGEGVLQGKLFGVAQAAYAIGDTAVIVLEGEFELPKIGSQAWAVGQKVYWDDANSRCTTVASGNSLIGGATAAVANGAEDVLGNVRLNGVTV